MSSRFVPRARWSVLVDCGDICFRESRETHDGGIDDESARVRSSPCLVQASFGLRAERAIAAGFRASRPLVLVFSAADQAAADVTRSGDVSPAFTPGPVVDLTSQTLLIGNISGGVGTIGTVNVTAGGILTAGRSQTGAGGLGTGFLNITGAGSVVHLSGASAPNVGFIVGQWGTGVVTVAQRRIDRLRVGVGVLRPHRQRCRLDGHAGDQRRLGHRTGRNHGRPGPNRAGLRHGRRQHHCDALDHQRRNVVIARRQHGGRQQRPDRAGDRQRHDRRRRFEVGDRPRLRERRCRRI